MLCSANSLAHYSSHKPTTIISMKRAYYFILGGFKFQVQRVNNGAVAHRLPGAWRN